MKAKINFLGSELGDHPNVLKFVGAVMNDPNSKLNVFEDTCIYYISIAWKY